MKGAKEGTVVAGGHGHGDALTQLSSPRGVVVDQWGTIYVADFSNHRIMLWVKGAKKGNIIVGENGKGKQANQLDLPTDLSFDHTGVDASERVMERPMTVIDLCEAIDTYDSRRQKPRN